VSNGNLVLSLILVLFRIILVWGPQHWKFTASDSTNRFYPLTLFLPLWDCLNEYVVWSGTLCGNLIIFDCYCHWLGSFISVQYIRLCYEVSTLHQDILQKLWVLANVY
jgi:hypothetical protein